MKRLLVSVLCLFAAGCGGGIGVSGPGEISLAGLTYDVRPGMGFVGMAETGVAAMPVTGGATYTGQVRGNIIDTYQTGAAQVVADFAVGTAVASGSVDFAGADGFGIVSYNETATISGNGFSHSSLSSGPGVVTVSGKFYGPGADVAAGIVGVEVTGGNIFVGAFITAK